MKNQNKWILIIPILCLSLGLKAQTVSANCKTINLNKEQVAYLKSFNYKVVNSALDNCKTIKYNSTADLIIAMIEARRKDTLFIADKKR